MLQNTRPYVALSLTLYTLYNALIPPVVRVIEYSAISSVRVRREKGCTVESKWGVTLSPLSPCVEVLIGPGRRQELGDHSAERARFDVGGERQEVVLPTSKGEQAVLDACTRTSAHTVTGTGRYVQNGI